MENTTEKNPEDFTLPGVVERLTKLAAEQTPTQTVYTRDLFALMVAFKEAQQDQKRLNYLMTRAAIDLGETPEMVRAALDAEMKKNPS